MQSKKQCVEEVQTAVLAKPNLVCVIVEKGWQGCWDKSDMGAFMGVNKLFGDVHTIWLREQKSAALPPVVMHLQQLLRRWHICVHNWHAYRVAQGANVAMKKTLVPLIEKILVMTPAPDLPKFLKARWGCVKYTWKVTQENKMWMVLTLEKGTVDYREVQAVMRGKCFLCGADGHIVLCLSWDKRGLLCFQRAGRAAIAKQDIQMNPFLITCVLVPVVLLHDKDLIQQIVLWLQRRDMGAAKFDLLKHIAKSVARGNQAQHWRKQLAATVFADETIRLSEDEQMWLLPHGRN
jgi:hypothetical protein